MAHCQRGLTHLGLFETCVNAGLEISQVAEDTLLKFLHIPHGATKRLKAKDEGTDNVCTSNVVVALPQYARYKLPGGESETVEGGMLLGVGERDGARSVGRGPSRGCSREELLETVEEVRDSLS